MARAGASRNRSVGRSVRPEGRTERYIPSVSKRFFFPANQQRQIRMQLSLVLQAVVSQQLVPTVDGGIVPVFACR